MADVPEKLVDLVAKIIPRFEGWRRCADYLPPDGETVLTQHEDDLYPVTAYHMGGVWLRETEGPEDITTLGRHEPLFRPPTHWRPLPSPPTGSGG